MKLQKFGAVAAALAATGLIGCSSDNGPREGENKASVSFNLTADHNIQIDAIHYDLNTQGGADVTAGDIQVPDQDPTHLPLLGIQALASGSYYLVLSATGVQTTTGQAVICSSVTTAAPLGTAFSLAPSEQNHFIGDITMSCSVNTQVDTTGSATADVSVVVNEITVAGVVETLTYGPRNVHGHKNGTACEYPAIHVLIAGTHAGVTYAWAPVSPADGALVLNASNTEGDFTCASDGDKTLSVTGTSGDQATTKSFTVHCDGAPCNFVCGNGTKEGSEQCDEATPRCNQANCTITPVCGDGVTDPGECEPRDTAVCDHNCHPVAPSCGDGFITGGEQCEPPNTLICSSTCQNITGCGNGVLEAGEVCDNGLNNSNTTPNACRTNCQNPSCGDGTVDTGEQCEPPGVGTCNATCQTQVSKDAACITCIEGSATAPLQTGYIDNDPKALAVEKCVINAGCFSPLPGFCYCGINDVDACSQSTFTPVGPCVTEIKAGTAATTNSAILGDYFGFGTSSGSAFGTLNDVFVSSPECVTPCF